MPKQVAEKCTWEPHCPICENKEEHEEDWDSNMQNQPRMCPQNTQHCQPQNIQHPQQQNYPAPSATKPPAPPTTEQSVSSVIKLSAPPAAEQPAVI